MPRRWPELSARWLRAIDLCLPPSVLPRQRHRLSVARCLRLPVVMQPGALYEVIATRYEKKATIVTSNKSLTEWGRVLHDSALAAALVDRLMHHGDVYYVKGESYRIRGKPRTESPEPPAPEPVAENRDGSSGS